MENKHNNILMKFTEYSQAVTKLPSHLNNPKKFKNKSSQKLSSRFNMSHSRRPRPLIPTLPELQSFQVSFENHHPGCQEREQSGGNRYRTSPGMRG